MKFNGKILLIISIILYCLAFPYCSNKESTTSPCDNITQIKYLGKIGEPSNDKAFNLIISEGDSIIPCLINKVIDTTYMEDPRTVPSYHDVVVGDVAFFLIFHVSKPRPSVKEFLPYDLQPRFDTIGINAYLEYVQIPENRKTLHDKLNKWYNNEYKKQGKLPNNVE